LSTGVALPLDAFLHRARRENRIADRKHNRLEKRASATLDAKQKRKWNQY
jgi:hypothetical protein